MKDAVPGLVAVVSLTAFAAITWWPAIFLVWTAAALRYEWAKSKGG